MNVQTVRASGELQIEDFMDWDAREIFPTGKQLDQDPKRSEI